MFLDELDDEALVDELRADTVAHRRATARRARIVAELDRRDTFRSDGHCTVHGLVRTVTLCPTSESKALLRVGQLLRRFPTIGAAMDAGELGVAQANPARQRSVTSALRRSVRRRRRDPAGSWRRS